MPEDLMQYDLMARNALRGVIKAALEKAAGEGLPGEHHFYIAFSTSARGVQISPRLVEKYPNEMTIVLQHQFWDLDVRDDHFSIGLSFSNIPEKLVIPYSAVISFYDPTVQFGLQFEDAIEQDAIEQAPHGQDAEAGDENAEQAEASMAPEPPAETADKDSGVVSLDAFRKKK